MKEHGPMMHLFKARRVSQRYSGEYQSLKNAVYERLHTRPNFQQGVDTALIDLAARLRKTCLGTREDAQPTS